MLGCAFNDGAPKVVIRDANFVVVTIPIVVDNPIVAFS
jgi:hypothetical protein